MHEHMGKVAVFDLDDCLGDMRNVLMHILNKESGLDLHWTDWSTTDAESMYNVSSDRFFDLALGNGLLEQMQPHDDASFLVKQCINYGLEVVVLTARGWHPDGVNVTTKWLNEHDIPYDQLIVCDVQDTKADYIRDREVLFTVDDSARHCNAYAQQRSSDFVFAYDFPWTGPYLNPESDIVRIKSLSEIGNHIEGLLQA